MCGRGVTEWRPGEGKKLTGKPIPQKRLLSTARGRKGERRIGTDPTLKVLRQLLFRIPLSPPSGPLLQLPCHFWTLINNATQKSHCGKTSLCTLFLLSLSQAPASDS